MATPIRIDETLLSRLCPARPETGHKGTFGRLLIYAGSTGMGGAAVMAAGSALRSGAGLVYVLTPKDVLTPLLIRCPEALGIPLPEEKESSSPLVPMSAGLGRLMPPAPSEKENWFSSILSDKQAVLMGPGLQTERKDVLTNLPFAIENAPHLVLDAGALTVLSKYPEMMDLLKMYIRVLLILLLLRLIYEPLNLLMLPIHNGKMEVLVLQILYYYQKHLLSH